MLWSERSMLYGTLGTLVFLIEIDPSFLAEVLCSIQLLDVKKIILACSLEVCN